jgi:hypothetical protein
MGAALRMGQRRKGYIAGPKLNLRRCSQLCGVADCGNAEPMGEIIHLSREGEERTIYRRCRQAHTCASRQNWTHDTQRGVLVCVRLAGSSPSLVAGEV